MDLSAKKRLAAEVLKVGVSRVRFDPDAAEEIADAITRASIRDLIKKGVIWAEPKKGVSRGRHRLDKKKSKRGPGSKKGAKTARAGKKELWVTRVRALRRRLKLLRDRGVITGKVFDQLYRQIKGGQVRSIRHLNELVKEVSKA
ncbi:MAG: 50S ribosomal protein L19e [Thaumarchaeota archaeon]|jgi:large subunit ribosomal protein L19e|nr:50S ribosomal protein L19e [Nitrososphaerota archaeon]